ASRARLIRQMLAESALLTFPGAASGLLAALAAMPFLDRALPPIRHLDATTLPLNIRIEPDLRILGFSVATSLLTTVLFCLGPAFHATSRSNRRWRGRVSLVVAQVALCTFLLTSAALLLNTFERLRQLNPGFDQDRVITFSTDPRMSRYTPHQARTLEHQL